MKTIFCFFFLAVTSLGFGQEFNDANAIEFNVLKGNVLPHSPELYNLITGHPDGFMISFSKKTRGKELWHTRYNYPDYGGYFLYEDFKNEILGKNIALGAHYNFYFLNRHLVFKIAQGIAMTSHSYDKFTNPKNKAFGSKYLGNTNLFLTFKKENIVNQFGIEAGFFFSHFSNGRFKSPNTGINIYGINVGVNYNFEKINYKSPDSILSQMKFRQPIKFNFLLRTGFNESPTVGSGQKPFYHLGFYADKRINRKSALQLGTELFLTTSLKEYIHYRSIAFPDDHLAYNTDYKRVGVFIGHELFINRISLETQIGVYVYRPYNLDIPIYDRLGMKYYITDKIFTGIAVKTHGFLAEATEFTFGVRL